MNPTDKQQSGKKAEQLAAQFLEKNHLILIEENYRCYSGEIDIIMRDKEDIVFVEVRSRQHIGYGNALESVDKHKMKKLIKAAKHFLQSRKLLYKVTSRFDIIAIHPVAGKQQLEWIKNAFTVDNDW